MNRWLPLLLLATIAAPATADWAWSPPQSILHGDREELTGSLAIAEMGIGSIQKAAEPVAARIRAVTSIEVSTADVSQAVDDSPETLDAARVPVLMLSGTARSRPSETQRNALRRYIEAGGFVVVSGRSQRFSERMRDWARDAFASTPPMELAPMDGSRLPDALRAAVEGIRTEGVVIDSKPRLVLLPTRDEAKDVPSPTSEGERDLLTAVLLLAALGSPQVQQLEETAFTISARRDGDRVLLTAVATADLRLTSLYLALMDMDDVLAANSVMPEAGASDVRVELEAPIRLPFDPSLYWVQARGKGNDLVVARRTNLAEVLGSLDTELLGQDRWLRGSPASVRVIARDARSSMPVAGAVVRAAVTADGKTLAVSEGTTDAAGSVSVRFDRIEASADAVELAVDVQSPLGDDAITRTIRIESSAKILLTADKPIYQPGQTIHLRALCLRESDLRPIADGTLTFEIEDAKGNKVFKRIAERNRFGVAAADFLLADELNAGPYTLRAMDGPTTQEKTVTVERYVLPKFRTTVELDQPHYSPGATVSGSVQADYFFGKPVAGGTVEISAAKFDVGFEPFAKLTGKTDETGRYAFELELPDYFVGTPLDAGKSFVQFEVTVTDGAEHAETSTVTRPVVASPITLVVVPEGGELVPGVENQVYVVSTSPSGEAVQASVTLKLGNQEWTETSDAAGITTFYITPQPGNSLVEARARTPQGVEAEVSVSLDERGFDTVLLRPDRSVVKAGDVLTAEVLSARDGGYVYVDVIRSRQTVLTKSAPIQAHRARVSFPLGADDFGMLELHAYVVGTDGNIRRDTRVVYASEADDLSIAVHPSKDTYAPGEDAEVRFHVSDREGHPVLAALGVTIVDESVFARQENQPGLERVFFLLEKELLQPRYEIHGFEPDFIVTPQPRPLERRAKAARVLFAAAQTLRREPTLSVRSTDAKRERRHAELVRRLERPAEKIRVALKRYLEADKDLPTDGDLIAALIQSRLLHSADADDPWGNRLRLSNVLASPGPDGREGTLDDIEALAFEEDWRFEDGKYLQRIAWRFGQNDVAEGIVLIERSRDVSDMPRRARRFGLARGAMIEEQLEMADGAIMFGRAVGGAGAMNAMKMAEVAAMAAPAAAPMPEVAPTRLREFFPETLLVTPSLITDEKGDAVLRFPVADSITTWRASVMASSLNGLLGSTTAGIRVFQDFFLDIDLPVSLTVGDEVSVPVALYNYLDTNQDLRIEFETGEGIELVGASEQRATLASGAVTVRYFKIIAKKAGSAPLTVRGYGTRMGDAVRRRVDIVPDGREVRDTVNDRLKGTVQRTVTVPRNAVPDASKVFVKLYPGAFSQVVEGLDAILQMPFGCFEQTSSATYPNILALRYLRTTGKNTPEVQLKAEGYISLGYQRLLSFEVDGGGFEWFGNAPANQLLTAYGLMEFADMASVHEVDAAVIQRTAAWLLGKQGKDGSWKPDASYLHAESWGRIQSNELLPTAYILWALGEAKTQDERVGKGIDYLRGRWQNARDPYMLALIANALVTSDAAGKATGEVMARLKELAVVDGDAVHWKSELPTMTYARDESSNLEATCLATLAFLKWGKDPSFTEKSLTYLVRAKDPNGTWHTTQATILALKALLMGSEGGGATRGEVTVSIDGKSAQRLEVTPEDSDVVRLVDFGAVDPGEHTVKLTFEGEGSLLYQIVTRFYEPWRERDRVGEQPLRIGVTYDKTRLAQNDVVRAECVVENQSPRAAKMVIVDLGIPPGFSASGADFEALVASKTIQKFQMTPRQVTLYFDELEPKKPLTLRYELRAKYPNPREDPGIEGVRVLQPGGGRRRGSCGARSHRVSRCEWLSVRAGLRP